MMLFALANSVLFSWGGFAAAGAAKRQNKVYELFFDLEEETPQKVEDVLKMIFGDGSDDGAIGEVVGTMIIDNNGKSHSASFSDWSQ